jgi:hypothetical protein
MVTSQLFGDVSQAYAAAPIPSNGDKSVYRHTEAAVYFPNTDLAGHTVSCYVYFPSGLINSPHETYAQLEVKDSQGRDSLSGAVNITPQNTNQWMQIAFAVGANADGGFLANAVHGLGLKVVTNHGSTLDYEGPFYINACSL